MEKYPKKRAYARGKLKRFLDEKGVYDKFVNACKMAEMEEARPKKDIRNAFTWSKAVDGAIFWSKLSKEYDEQT